MAQVDLATDEFTKEEKVLQLTAEIGPFIERTGSGIDCSLNLFAPVYLSSLCPVKRPYLDTGRQILRYRYRNGKGVQRNVERTNHIQYTHYGDILDFP